MATRNNSRQNGHENRNSEANWSKHETAILVRSREAGYSFEEITMHDLPEKSISDCESQIEVLRRSGRLPDKLTKTSNPRKRRNRSPCQSGRSRPRRSCSRDLVRDKRGRFACNSPADDDTCSSLLRGQGTSSSQQPTSSVNHVDTAEVQASEVSNTGQITPSATPTEEENSSITIISSVDSAAIHPSSTHDTTRSTGGSDATSLPAKVVDKDLIYRESCVSRIRIPASDEPQVHEASSSDVDSGEIFNEARELLDRTSKFGTEYYPVGVDDRKINVWLTNFTNLMSKLLK